MERVQNFFGRDDGWHEVHSRDGNFKVRMPGQAEAWQPQERPLKDVELVGGWTATAETEGGAYSYFVAGSKADAPPVSPGDAWFDKLTEQLKDAGGQLETKTAIEYEQKGEKYPGRQWTFQLPGEAVRIVRVYVVRGRVYYLSAKGPNLAPDDKNFGQPFFRYFDVLPPPRKR